MEVLNLIPSSRVSRQSGMIFIQGGTFVKGNAKDNAMHDWNNTPSQQYVRSFLWMKPKLPILCT